MSVPRQRADRDRRGDRRPADRPGSSRRRRAAVRLRRRRDDHCGARQADLRADSRRAGRLRRTRGGLAGRGRHARLPLCARRAHYYRPAGSCSFEPATMRTSQSLAPGRCPSWPTTCGRCWCGAPAPTTVISSMPRRMPSGGARFHRMGWDRELGVVGPEPHVARGPATDCAYGCGSMWRRRRAAARRAVEHIQRLSRGRTTGRPPTVRTCATNHCPPGRFEVANPHARCT